MKMKEESSFLQGVESRLDSLFAEDAQPIKEKDSELPQTIVQEVASDVKEDIREIPDIKETSLKAEVSSEPIQTQDKSSFISEIEKRFSAIFGEDDKGVSAFTDTAAPDDLKKVIAEAEQEESKKVDQSLEDLSSTSSSVLQSPLKDMKSIILSLEWEINDHILEQLEDEINKLYLLYTGDRIIQGFLRILRFMGRYVRVRGVRSNQDSINLLLSVYDHLEDVMVSEGMTEAKKHIILIDNIKKYREWVENTDLETREETQIPETIAREVKSSGEEPLEVKFLEDQKANINPLTDIEVAKEEPIVEGIIDKAVVEEPFLRGPEEDKTGLAMAEQEVLVQTQPIAEGVIDEAVVEEPFLREPEEAELTIKEPEILTQQQPAPMAETALFARSEELENAIAAIKDLPPHEAFVYALEEIKKAFRSELDVLKEEIRILKSAR